MSNRRRKKRHPWGNPSPAHDRIHDLTVPGAARATVLADGADAGVLAAMRAFHGAGASSVEFGFDPPAGYEHVDDAPAGVPVVWWWRVTWPAEGDQPERIEEGRAAPTTDHALGLLQAAAVILRRGGANVSILDGR